MIAELIVVEGKDDIAAVKNALECEVLATGGYHFGKDFLRQLQDISARRDIIVLTDPDYAGEKIRRRITAAVPTAKHAYLPEDKATKRGDVGVENARPEDIREAIKRAKPHVVEARREFTLGDLLATGLAGGADAAKRRKKIGERLGIGYANGKGFLSRLNNFGIEREEWEEALAQEFSEENRQ